MKLNEKAIKILDRPICDYCLGTQFAEVLTGYSNKKRGNIIRKNIAMLIDSESINSSEIDPSNFFGFNFRLNKKFSRIITRKKQCWLCNNIFDGLERIIRKTEKKVSKLEFDNFLVGSKIPDDILNREEKIWETIGIEYCEPLKNTINRMIGIELEKRLSKPVDFKRPDIVIHIDLDKNDVRLQINSIYVFGFYKKMKRGIPQCKWGTPGKYKTSIQEIIAKPLTKVTKSKKNKFSGSGREDIDARNLSWRAFVIELLEPEVRKINLKEIQKKINKSNKVNVKNLKYSDKKTVVKIKTETGEKTYRVLARLDKNVEKKDLKKLKQLVGVINQRTPTRVSARRADLFRKRRVKDIKYKLLNRKTIELKIRSAAGLYIKELVSGDGGRTKPSLAEILGVKAIPKDLDVIHIERPKGL